MGILQTRVLGWISIPFSRGTSQPRDWTCVSCISRQILYHWASREAQAPFLSPLKLKEGLPGWSKGLQATTAGVKVPPLVEELRYHMLHSTTKTQRIWRNRSLGKSSKVTQLIRGRLWISEVKVLWFQTPGTCEPELHQNVGHGTGKGGQCVHGGSTPHPTPPHPWGLEHLEAFSILHFKVFPGKARNYPIQPVYF